MLKNFRLPTADDQEIAIIYQKPLEETVLRGPEPVKAINSTTKEKPVPIAKPLVVMLHGFPGGHKAGRDDLYGALEARLEKLGYPSVRFDFRGCGESDGQPVDFSLESAGHDLNAVIAWAKGEGHKTFVFIGEDVGAAVAITNYDAVYVTGLVLLWPTVIMKDTALRTLYTFEARQAADELDAPFVQYGEYRLGLSFYNEAYKTDLAPFLERIKAPVLIQHGSKDTEVPLEQAYVARDALRVPGEIAVFEGGDHGLTKPNMRNALYTNIEYFLPKALKLPGKA